MISSNNVLEIARYAIRHGGFTTAKRVCSQQSIFPQYQYLSRLQPQYRRYHRFHVWITQMSNWKTIWLRSKISFGSNYSCAPGIMASTCDMNRRPFWSTHSWMLFELWFYSFVWVNHSVNSPSCVAAASCTSQARETTAISQEDSPNSCPLFEECKSSRKVWNIILIRYRSLHCSWLGST